MTQSSWVVDPRTPPLDQRTAREGYAVGLAGAPKVNPYNFDNGKGSRQQDYSWGYGYDQGHREYLNKLPPSDDMQLMMESPFV